MTDIEERSIGHKVDKIIGLLQGNELDPNDDGLVGAINDLSKRLVKLEKLKDKIFYVVVGMSLPAGYGITKLIADFGNKVFHIQ